MNKLNDESKVIITNDLLRCLVLKMAHALCNTFAIKGQPGRSLSPRLPVRPIKCYPVLRGGYPVALALQQYLNVEIVSDADFADVIIDDIIDSGSTVKRFFEQRPLTPFVALIDKRVDEEYVGKWVVFPWEGDADGGVEDNIRRLLQFVGEDPNRGGLVETPKRVSKAWLHWCNGYNIDVPSLFKQFEDGAEGYDQMIVVDAIPFYSHCEHHMAPFFGVVKIGYIPNKSIIGLSKLVRVVNAFSHRLQVQERLTSQICDAINDNLKPLGVGVTIKARHLCMESRGISCQGHSTVTTALRGFLKEEAAAKQEFLDHVGLLGEK